MFCGCATRQAADCQLPAAGCRPFLLFVLLVFSLFRSDKSSYKSVCDRPDPTRVRSGGHTFDVNPTTEVVTIVTHDNGAIIPHPLPLSFSANINYALLSLSCFFLLVLSPSPSLVLVHCVCVFVLGLCLPVSGRLDPLHVCPCWIPLFVCLLLRPERLSGQVHRWCGQGRAGSRFVGWRGPTLVCLLRAVGSLSSRHDVTHAAVSETLSCNGPVLIRCLFLHRLWSGH